MNKKGFTLIEILAAMAVLSLITLMIIPNVISSINEAKKSTFVNECRNIYKVANSSYVYDSVKTNDDKLYAENFAMFAPLCVKDIIPDFFLIFKAFSRRTPSNSPTTIIGFPFSIATPMSWMAADERLQQ